MCIKIRNRNAKARSTMVGLSSHLLRECINLSHGFNSVLNTLIEKEYLNQSNHITSSMIITVNMEQDPIERAPMPAPVTRAKFCQTVADGAGLSLKERLQRLKALKRAQRLGQTPHGVPPAAATGEPRRHRSPLPEISTSKLSPDIEFERNLIGKSDKVSMALTESVMAVKRLCSQTRAQREQLRAEEYRQEVASWDAMHRADLRRMGYIVMDVLIEHDYVGRSSATPLSSDHGSNTADSLLDESSESESESGSTSDSSSTTEEWSEVLLQAPIRAATRTRTAVSHNASDDGEVRGSRP